MRIFKWLLGVAIYAVFFLAAVWFGFLTGFYGPPPRANFPKPHDLAEAQTQDLSYFENFFTLDKSWTPETMAAAKAKLTELQARVHANALSPVEFVTGVLQMVALADNGHTQVGMVSRMGIGNQIPLKLYAFADGYYVVRANAANADLLGARLESVDGRGADDANAVVRTLSGGLPASRDMRGVFAFQSPEQLHVLGIAQSADKATYTFHLANGATVTRTLVGAPPMPDKVWPREDRLLAAEPIAGEDQQTKAMFSADHEPMAFQEPDKLFRVIPLPQLNALYIELRQNSSTKDQPLPEFLKQTTAEIKARKPHNIILDMRFNGGGNYTLSASFMKSLPTLVDGQVFVLTSLYTFSAAITGVGFVKQAGGGRTVIVGDPVGDREIFYAEGNNLTLPNSGLLIHYATGLHDYKNGCKWFGPCFWVNYLSPIAVPSLAPDIEAPFAGLAVAAGHDPGLEAITAALAGRS